MDRKVVLIIIFTSLLFLFNLGKRDLWAPDEPRYAQVSKEMWEGSDFILPRLNGQKYPDKPPVLFWLIILFSTPIGEITELSARLPSALAGIGCAIITYYFGRRLFSARAGFLAALILSTNIKFLTISRRVSFDGLITFFITLSLFFFYTGYIRNERNTRYFLLSYLFMAIATITKGPVGFAVPILVIATFLCIVKFGKYKSEFRMRNMRIWLGSLIVFSIPLLWVLGIYLQGGLEHTKEVVFSQNIGRTVNSFAHKRPFYYFFTTFLSGFSPWSLFIPSVIIYYIKTISVNPFKPNANYRKTKADDNTRHLLNPESLARKPQSALLFPAVWFIVVFTFFSIMSGKRSSYIMPLYPAASLFVSWLLGSFISHVLSKRFERISCRLPLQIAYGILIIAGIGLPVWTFYQHPAFFVSAFSMSAVIICGQIISFIFLSSARPAKALTSTFIVFLITVMLGTQILIPIMNDYKTDKPFCEKIDKIIGPDGKFASYNYVNCAYLFYTGTRNIEGIGDIEKLNNYLNSDERVYLLSKENEIEMVKKDINAKVYTLIKDSIGHNIMVFISNKPKSDEIDQH